MRVVKNKRENRYHAALGVDVLKSVAELSEDEEITFDIDIIAVL
jgi:hypothetical protein